MQDETEETTLSTFNLLRTAGGSLRNVFKNPGKDLPNFNKIGFDESTLFDNSFGKKLTVVGRVDGAVVF